MAIRTLVPPLQGGGAQRRGLNRDITAPTERSSVDKSQPPSAYADSPLWRGHEECAALKIQSVRVSGLHNYSLFIIHYSLTAKAPAVRQRPLLFYSAFGSDTVTSVPSP